MSNDYALVTGASRGIGASIAKQLAKDGYNILLNYKSNDLKAKEVCADIIKIGKKCELLKCDVSDYTTVCNILESHMRNKKIKILVNNAANPIMKAFDETTENDWDLTISVILGGFYNLTSNIIPYMIKNNGGKIINITSIGAFNADVNVAYVAAKAGLVGATRALANEMKTRNININAVAPGPVDTAFLPDTIRKKICSMPHLKIDTPQDIANIVSFLCSDMGNDINGQIFTIDCGKRLIIK